MATQSYRTLDRAGLDCLLAALARRGWQTVGPVIRDRVMVYSCVASTADLPVGWADCHEPGRYCLYERGDGALFGYVVGPGSPKYYLYPPQQTLLRLQRSGDGFGVEPDGEVIPPRALFGVRPCELAAIAIQDRVFLQGPYQDPHYQARREKLFVVAVNCTEPGGTCFCVSQDTGPRAHRGFDLALTEFPVGDQWRYLVETGSARGGELLVEAGGQPATAAEIETVNDLLEAARGRMGRTLDNQGIKELLYRNLNHPRWEEVADRCLSCANCTLVCPTCFCSTVTDSSDLTGETASRERRWDSCFNRDFSYIVGGSVRRSTAARYRQWLTHKLASWQDQFGTSGCVGCGRCITWCPVGIDITQEARLIRQRDGETAL